MTQPSMRIGQENKIKNFCTCFIQLSVNCSHFFHVFSTNDLSLSSIAPQLAVYTYFLFAVPFHLHDTHLLFFHYRTKWSDDQSYQQFQHECFLCWHFSLFCCRCHFCLLWLLLVIRVRNECLKGRYRWNIMNIIIIIVMF